MISSPVVAGGNWDTILPNPASITEIPVTWKNGYRLNNGVEATSSSCSITNEYIYVGDYDCFHDFLLVVATDDNVFNEAGYSMNGCFFKEDKTFGQNWPSSPPYAIANKFYCLNANWSNDNADNRKWLRLQMKIGYLPKAVYKVHFN